MPLSRIEVAVCDTDTEYRDRFVTYLIEHRAGEYAVHAFSSPELWAKRSEEEKIDVAVCGMGFAEAGRAAAARGIPVLFLRETMPKVQEEPGMVAEAGGYRVVGTEKYQSAEAEYPSIRAEDRLTGAEEYPSAVRVADVFRYQPIEIILHEVQVLLGVPENTRQ